MTAIGYFSNNTSPSAYNGGLTSHVILDLPATTNATTYKLQGQVLKLVLESIKHDITQITEMLPEVFQQ